MLKLKTTQAQAQIIVAIIGLVGIIITGIFLVQAAKEPILLSIQLTQNANLTSVAQSATQVTSTLVPSAIQTATESNLPITPLIIRQDCFDQSLWMPYKKDSNSSTSEKGCLNLSTWGFFARDNGLLIFPDYPLPAGQFHGIYTPISNYITNSAKAEIRFKIQIEKIDVASDRSANIGIGIINLDPPGLASSRLIFYHYIPQVSSSNIDLNIGIDGNYDDALPYSLAISSSQEVTLIIDGPVLTVVIDGHTLSNIIKIPFEKRALWISYSLPQGGLMKANIYDLEIGQP